MKIRKLKFIFTLAILGFLVLPSLGRAQVASSTADAKPNAADNIDVELKVPLPFVKTHEITIPDPKIPNKTIKVQVVKNLKDYIEGFYRLIIGAGAVFAVVMIIVAGYQWMLNGGSSGQVGDAKKRIWNASVGLVLALLSYIILNTISARLVDLNLPKVEPIPPFLAGEGNYCSSDQYTNLLKGVKDPKTFLAEVYSNGSSGDFTKSLDDAACGTQYLVANNGGQCGGDICFIPNTKQVDPEQKCIDNKCSDALIHGKISWGQGLGSNSYVDEMWVTPVCENMSSGWLTLFFLDPTNNGVTGVKSTSFLRYYAITKTDFARAMFPNGRDMGVDALSAVTKTQIETFLNSRCSMAGGVKGFALKVSINDDTDKIMPTIDDNFILGKGCQQPFSGKDVSGKRVYSGDKIDWLNTDKAKLFSVADIMHGVECDIVIDRDLFPAT